MANILKKSAKFVGKHSYLFLFAYSATVFVTFISNVLNESIIGGILVIGLFSVVGSIFLYSYWKLILSQQIRDYIVTKYAKQIANKFNKAMPCDDPNDDINSKAHALFINWQKVYDTWPDSSLRKLTSNDEIAKVLVREYCGTLDKWCKQNFQNKWFLWHDEHRINLIIFSDHDQVLFFMRFGNDYLPDGGEVLALQNELN